MSGPDALGVAVSGLLVRDPVRAVTGIAFPTAGEDGWVDRAGLMEREWEQAVPGLTRPFLEGDEDRVTGALVLNSTSVTSRCRTLLSQVELDPAPSALDCQTTTAPPDSVDLLPAARVDCAGSAPSLRATTVALLASRFPYVTPSGVVTSDCAGEGSLRSQQVVDGGYADNDGIGTVVDLTASGSLGCARTTRPCSPRPPRGRCSFPCSSTSTTDLAATSRPDRAGRRTSCWSRSSPRVPPPPGCRPRTPSSTVRRRCSRSSGSCRGARRRPPGRPPAPLRSAGPSRAGVARWSRCSTSRRGRRSRPRSGGCSRGTPSTRCAARATTRSRVQGWPRWPRRGRAATRLP